MKKDSLWRNKTNIDKEKKKLLYHQSLKEIVWVFIFKNMYEKNASAKLCMKHIGFTQRSKF